MSTGHKTLRTRIGERLEKYRPETQVRQLRALQKAYSGASGPDVLIFGDSMMVWAAPGDADKRSLVQMVQDDLPGSTVHTIVGPLYQPRIVMAFLTALENTASRPRVVVVPTSLMMASDGWLSHPTAGYVAESAAITELARRPIDKTRTIPHATGDDWEKWDRTKAPSIIGHPRTYGEHRQLIASVPANEAQLPTTKWQHLVRLRHMIDFAYAQKLDRSCAGVEIVAQVAEEARKLDVPAVAYIPPVNYEIVGKLCGKTGYEHVVHNAGVIQDAFLEGGGKVGVVNAVLDSPASEFGDPVHVDGVGRKRLAGKIAAEIRNTWG